MLDEVGDTQVIDIVSRKPVCIKSQATVLAAALAMTEGRRGAAIIMDDEEKLLGIFTERHLLSKVDHESFDWHDLSIDNFMTENPKTIKESQTVREALEVMLDGNIRHLPIIDSTDHVAGILSIRDIIVHVTDHYPEEFLNLPPDPSLEATDQYGG